MGFFSRKKKSKTGEVVIHSNANEFYTSGLKSYINKELKVEKRDLTPEQINPILRYIIEFIQEDELDIRHGDRLSCFSWSIRLGEEGDYYEIFEVYPEKEGYVPGLRRTYEIYTEQMSVCNQLGATPEFPIFDQLVTISVNVKNGYVTHLFRWNKEEPDSGWVAMTENTDPDQVSFENMTLGQLMTIRPELVKFLALPPGYKVISEGDDAKIAFDEQMANSDLKT